MQKCNGILQAPTGERDCKMAKVVVVAMTVAVWLWLQQYEKEQRLE